MKVQFAKGRMRIRLDRDAFEALCEGRPQSLLLPLLAGGACVEIVRADSIEVSCDGVATRIALPGSDLDALARRLPCRDGVRWELADAATPAVLVLEVDVRSPGAPHQPETR